MKGMSVQYRNPSFNSEGWIPTQSPINGSRAIPCDDSDRAARKIEAKGEASDITEVVDVLFRKGRCAIADNQLPSLELGQRAHSCRIGMNDAQGSKELRGEGSASECEGD